MFPYIIEPYNAYQKPPKKKHWMEIAEEESLMARIIAEAATSTNETANASSAAPAGAGGVPSYDYFHPIRLEYLPTSALLDWGTGDDFGGDYYSDVTLSDFRTIEPSQVKTISIYKTDFPLTSISNLSQYNELTTLQLSNQTSESVVSLLNQTIPTPVHILYLDNTYITSSGNLFANRPIPNLRDVYLQTNNIPTMSLSSSTLTYLEAGSCKMGWIDVSNTPSLQQLRIISNQLHSLNNVTGSTSIQKVFVSGNSLSSSLNISSMSSLTQFTANTCGITQLTASSLTNVTTLIFESNTLSAVNISGSPLINNIRLAFNDISSANVNTVLLTLASGSVSNGTITIDGGTNGAPSGQGSVAKTVLQGRGWTVQTN